MTWAPLLLADPSPLLRLRVLRDLLNRPADDPEVLELAGLGATDPLVTRLLEGQQGDGSWQRGLVDDTSASTPVLATALALMRLGYLGLDANHPAVRRGAEYLFSQQRADGSWPLAQVREEGEGRVGREGREGRVGREGRESRVGRVGREGYSMIPLQTALPLRGLAACGYAQDRRAEHAYDWLLDQRLPDGAWPTGRAAGGVNGYVAGYRRLAHSRWGCRSNTTAALVCLVLHPSRRSSPEALRALDLLLGRETRETLPLGFEVARLLAAEPSHGFITFYARFDLALMLDLCGRAGLNAEDERVAEIIAFVRHLQGPFGLWEYAPRPQINRWLTFDLLRSISRLEQGRGTESWISTEPRTPFQPYPKKQKRY
jgi:hypothetical protein